MSVPNSLTIPSLRPPRPSIQQPQVRSLKSVSLLLFLSSFISFLFGFYTSGMSYDISPSLADSLHSVWQCLSPSCCCKWQEIQWISVCQPCVLLLWWTQFIGSDTFCVQSVGLSISCHVHMMILLLPFWSGCLVFIFLAWLSWLGFPIPCWIEVVRVGIFVLFQILVGGLSAFHSWVLCWLWVCHQWLLSLRYVIFSLYPLGWEFSSWTGVEFHQMLFLHLLKGSYGFCPLLIWGTTLTSLYMLTHPCESGMDPTWSWSMILLWVAGFRLLIFYCSKIAFLMLAFMMDVCARSNHFPAHPDSSWESRDGNRAKFKWRSASH